MAIFMAQQLKLRAVLHGRVQGVGFRLFALQRAHKLGLAGWVRNLPNGDVEVEAEGLEESLNAFLQEIQTKHPWARVDQVTADYYPREGKYSSFSIR